MNLYKIFAKFVPNVWNVVEPILEKAVAHNFGEMTMEDHFNDLVRGDSTLWVIEEDDEIIGCATTHVNVYPRKRHLMIHLMGAKAGNGVEIFERFTPQLAAYAKSVGCTALEAQVRKGLARRLKWDHEHSIVVKQI